MGRIILFNETTKNPITLIGKMAGTCWGADCENDEKNYKRGLSCLKAGHGRTWEYPEVYLTLDGYSARVIREWYTHIGGAPTRLQASTRYIDYEHGFEYITPKTICSNEEAQKIYTEAMTAIQQALAQIDKLGIPREDSANLLPLGMTTKVVCRINLRTLIDMSHQRLCTRAYWEYRQLFRDLMEELRQYSEEWAYIVDNYFEPKCKYLGHCPESYGCGLTPKK